MKIIIFNIHISRQIILVFLVTFVAWAYFWLPDYDTKVQMQKDVAKLKSDIGELKSKLNYNRERINLLKNDPVTIESEIRRNLRWVSAGELPVEAKNYE